jgi:hypothetical protein
MKRRAMNSKRQASRNPEGGYALLMVFLMAAIIALMLYQQLPRVAFETEREKEQLLIDRGEQYVRAIQLFYLANNRQYPTSLDDLEKRDKRFLRRRYIDPYTGKDEWRIIHGNGVFLTDSLVQKPPGTTDSSTQSASNTTPADGQPQVNAAVLQRPSDRPNTPAGFNQQSFGPTGQDSTGQAQSFNGALPPITLQAGQAGQPGGLPPITLQTAVGGNQPGGLPPITLSTPGTQPGTQGGAAFRVGGGVAAPQFPGQVPGQVPGQIPGQIPGQVPGQVPGQFPFPGQTAPGGLPGGIQTGIPPGFRIDTNGQLVPITPGPGQPPPGLPGGIPGQPASPQPGGAQDPNAALNLINQLLTNPRQTPTVQNTPTSGNQIGAIAGIASTHKGPSIKVYKDQDHYELWEFVFSPTASTVPGGAVGGAGGAGGRGGPNQPGGQPNGQPNPFGGQPGPFGGQSGPFGQPGGLGGGGRAGQPGGIFQPAPVGR